MTFPIAAKQPNLTITGYLAAVGNVIAFYLNQVDYQT